MDGHRVDRLCRDLDRVRRGWADCQEGRFEVGTRPARPLGVYSHTYVGEAAVGRVLADTGGELRILRERTRRHPEPPRSTHRRRAAGGPVHPGGRPQGSGTR
ncbi:hypothetical protein [Streptomyces sp. NPDC006309]|uniref:hypothetical protein n=1 Tax=Streptomyces sp. NPDC006309 TaxID=3156749 RepID=UPI0033B9D5E8